MNKRIKHTSSLLMLLVILSGLNLYSFAQNSANYVEGSISYITGKSIYVKFLSTQGIENGDTLFQIENELLLPVLIVQHHSSISCLCNAITEYSFKVKDIVFSKSKNRNNSSVLLIQNESHTENQIEQDVDEQVLIQETIPSATVKDKQEVTGNLSISSYSNFSNSVNEDLHRFRYTFSMNAKHISNSKLSAETYISFSHKLNQWDVVKENLNNALKVYSLALKYDLNESTTIWAGRKINPKIANIGAVDGIQFQKDFKHLCVGVVGGTRPDFQDYGINPKLLEYGAYIGQNQKVENGFVQSSLAFFEQRNNGNTDRRFIYFQHSNSVIKKVNIFSSFELDLFKIESGIPQNTLRLTSLYLSLSYRISRKISLFASYDNRKNVIYYETVKNYTDAILQQASRQGMRLRINYRPLKYLNLGVNGGTRFMKDDARATNTINGIATYTRIPLINSSLSLSANLMQTSYLDGQVYGARLSKDFLQGKFYTTLNYRWVQFNYVSAVSQLNQNIGEVDFTYQFNKKLYMSANYEATFQEKTNFNRVYLNLRLRF